MTTEVLNKSGLSKHFEVSNNIPGSTLFNSPPDSTFTYPEKELPKLFIYFKDVMYDNKLTEKGITLLPKLGMTKNKVTIALNNYLTSNLNPSNKKINDANLQKEVTKLWNYLTGDGKTQYEESYNRIYQKISNLEYNDYNISAFQHILDINSILTSSDKDSLQLFFNTVKQSKSNYNNANVANSGIPELFKITSTTAKKQLTGKGVGTFLLRKPKQVATISYKTHNGVAHKFIIIDYDTNLYHIEGKSDIKRGNIDELIRYYSENKTHLPQLRTRINADTEYDTLELTATKAEDELKDTESGTYMLRKVRNVAVLSFKQNASTVRHLEIITDFDTNNYYINTNKSNITYFTSINELIAHYKENPVLNTGVILHEQITKINAEKMYNTVIYSSKYEPQKITDDKITELLKSSKIGSFIIQKAEKENVKHIAKLHVKISLTNINRYNIMYSINKAKKCDSGKVIEKIKVGSKEGTKEINVLQASCPFYLEGMEEYFASLKELIEYYNQNSIITGNPNTKLTNYINLDMKGGKRTKKASRKTNSNKTKKVSLKKLTKLAKTKPKNIGSKTKKTGRKIKSKKTKKTGRK